MSQRPSVESPNQSQPNQSLHSVLQTALGSLDVHLEEELVRYRRQRTGRSVPPPRGLGRQQARKTLDLISVGAVGGRTQPQPMNSGVATSTDTTTASPSTTAPITPPVEPRAWSPSQEPRSESSFSSARSHSASQLAVLPRVPESEAPTAAYAEANSSETNTLISMAATQMPPDDYLESSEELLRSLAEEEAEARVERGFMQSLLTPLGLGSMLLLLLSSATLGYVLMNPSVLRPIGIGRSPNATSSTTTTNSTSVTPNSAAVGLPNSPNLASKEFVDLNLGTLSTLKANTGAGKVSATPGKSVAVPKVKAVPSANIGPAAGRTTTPAPATQAAAPRAAAPYVVQPVAPPLSIAPPPPPAAIYNQPVYNPPAAEPPVERYAPAPEPPRVEPAPVVVAPEPPAPRSRAAEPEAESAASSAPAGNSAYDYKVVTEYSGDATLEEAQKAIPDAYVKNFPDGARIQLGAFDEAGKAEALAEELEKQGIPAKVEQH
ncbi:hypothetical protein [Trichocoleus sp. FACHB-262]|uniref:hypothetical protein n=1 Tax=Trichocoleus sp. FACHB-262 TaxID=2692869 RepID=UPI001683EB5A|nr:hypothetical protein [Trichocoleus sp. FACHB-262]MBD2121251.1 hypothetical protein [Trichocoleus sp. FACHB-262]